jgi:putative inorganic carbon (HCO3(-)) transporter
MGLKVFKVISYKYFSYGLIFFMIINLLFIGYMIYKKKCMKNKADIFIIICILLAIISTIFAIKPKIALFGTIFRYEGLLEVIYYFTIMYLSSYVCDKDKKYIGYVIIGTGLLHSLFAINQKLVIFKFLYVSGLSDGGMTTNANFLAAYELIALCYLIYMYFKSSKFIHKLFCIFTYLILIVGLIFTNTLSCILALSFVLILVFIYAIKKKKYLEYLIILLLFIFNIFYLSSLGYSNIFSDIIKTKSEVSEISKGNVSDNFGTKRFFIWKNTVKIIPKYLLHGCGIDNFIFAFDGKSLKDEHFFYDKAHNEFLQLLVTEGIFSLISYLCLLVIVFINCFKSKKINIAMLVVIGYLIQSFFSIRVIEVAPIFFISLGFMIDREKCDLKRQLI